jgi:ferredoxin-NADP reductase
MKLTLLEKRNEFSDVVTFIFQPAEKVTWKAGQYYHYVLHHLPTDDRGSDRWFTIASAPFEEHIQITTRFSEKGSSFKKKLHDLAIGKKIEVTDVVGKFFVDDSSKEYVFIAGGIGITPFRSILKQLEHDSQPINVTLLYSNRDQHIVFKDELETIAKNNPTLKIHYIFSPEHIDEKKIRKLVPDFENKQFYISGPEPMVDTLIEMLKTMGIIEENIMGDWFPGYPVE